MSDNYASGPRTLDSRASRLLKLPPTFDRLPTLRVVTPTTEVVGRALSLHITDTELTAELDTGITVTWVKSRPGDEPLADDDRVPAYGWTVTP